MIKEMLNTVYILAGIYVLYKIYTMANTPSRELREELNDILNSDKYKVKGKFEPKA